MGLIQSSIRFLVREHLKKPLQGHILTLGRQFVYATLDELRVILEEEGVEPCKEIEADRKTNIPQWIGTDYERFTSDVTLFRLLGVESVQAMDYSDMEGAEIVHDLNRPVPENLWSRFDVILDFGTSEHVFDVRQAFENYVKMLKPEGRIIHCLPANNQVNHGFYQFSPTLFLDFYGANGFADMRTYLLSHDARTHEKSQNEFFAFPAEKQPLLMTSKEQMSVVFVAHKQAQATSGQIPLQGYYQDVFGVRPEETERGDAPMAAPRAEPPRRGSARWVFHRFRRSRRFGRSLRKRGKRMVRKAKKRLFPVDPSKKPWGLDLWTKM